MSAGVLHILALDLNAALVAYDAARTRAEHGIDGGVCPWPASVCVCGERVAEARATLGRAARALALWCDGELASPGPESHGARRSSSAPPPYVPDADRETARRLASSVRCRVCGGSGLAGLALQRPCVPCGGTGAA